MGQTLLANQFVAGLRPDLKRKLMGVDGTLEELVLKARFKEAKGREFSTMPTRYTQPPKEPAVKLKGTPKKTETTTTIQDEQPPATADEEGEQGTRGARNMRGRSFSCGMEGHIARECPYKRKGGGREAQGRKSSTMSALITTRKGAREMVESLRRQLQEAEALAAVDDSAGKLHRMSGKDGGTGGGLGPTIYTKVCVNGVPAKTLIDTGSPATIISLEFVMSIMMGERRKTQSREQWKIDTLKRLTPPTVSLRNYGGHPLAVIAQTPLQLSYGDRSIDTTVLIQKGAPNQLLLGTDVLSDLGFVLMTEDREEATDLLTGMPPCRNQEPPRLPGGEVLSSAGGPVVQQQPTNSRVETRPGEPIRQPTHSRPEEPT
jgi:hypothetical protein